MVACGTAHTLVATSLGRLYSFGANNQGQLGLDDTPTQVKEIEHSYWGEMDIPFFRFKWKFLFVLNRTPFFKVIFDYLGSEIVSFLCILSYD